MYFCNSLNMYVWRLALIGVARKTSNVHIYYWNNWWLLQFSITTVGYGDMTPQGKVLRDEYCFLVL